jgi:hypothetical protein
MRKLILDEMSFDVVFNRDISKETDVFAPDGCILSLADGRFVPVDFFHYEGIIDSGRKNVIRCIVSEPDIETFPEMEDLTPSDFIPANSGGNFLKLIFDSIYLGEDGESPGLEVVGVEDLSVCFERYFKNGKKEVAFIEVSDESILLDSSI